MSRILNSFDNFTSLLNNVINYLNTVDNYADTTEVSEVNKLIKKYGGVLSGSISNEEKVEKYTIFYNQLIEIEKNKRKEIVDVEEKINYLSDFVEDRKFSMIPIKKKNNTNKIIDLINSIVEKIRSIVTFIYNEKMKELNDLKVERYVVKELKPSLHQPLSKPLHQQPLQQPGRLSYQQPLQPIQPSYQKPYQQPTPLQQPLQQSYQQPTPLQQPSPQSQPKKKQVKHKRNANKKEDYEMGVINKSINILESWSNKQYYQIIFDSKTDGNGGNNVLHDKILNKSHLYFISSDEDYNVYGGYFNQTVDRNKGFFHDPNAFVFSLMRNGLEKNTKYDIIPRFEEKAFRLYSYNKYGDLYSFGYDIGVCEPGTKSCCEQTHYEYRGEIAAIVDKHNPSRFMVHRVIVIEMI